MRGLVCPGRASLVRAPPSFGAPWTRAQTTSIHSVGVPCPQYSLSAKRSSPDDGNDVSPYSLSPVSNKR